MFLSEVPNSAGISRRARSVRVGLIAMASLAFALIFTLGGFATTGAKASPNGLDQAVERAEMRGKVPSSSGSAVDGERRGYENRIIGGTRANPEDWPFHVSLTDEDFNTYPLSGPFCGAVAIHDNWILTAAHCVESVGWVNSVVGMPDLNEKTGRAIGSDDIFIHPGYREQTARYDAALVRVPEGADLDSIPRASVLPTGGTKAKVAGHGVVDTDSGLSSSYLLETEVEVLDQSVCELSYPGDIDRRSMFCAGAVGKDACWSDSGGALVSGGKLIGLVSWGYGCALPGKPGVYTRVDALNPWIDRVLARGFDAAVLRQSVKGWDWEEAGGYVTGAFTQPVKQAYMRFSAKVCDRALGRCYRAGRWFKAQRGGVYAGVTDLIRKKKKCVRVTIKAKMKGGVAKVSRRVCLRR